MIVEGMSSSNGNSRAHLGSITSLSVFHFSSNSIFPNHLPFFIITIVMYLNVDFHLSWSAVRGGRPPLPLVARWDSIFHMFPFIRVSLRTMIFEVEESIKIHMFELIRIRTSCRGSINRQTDNYLKGDKHMVGSSNS